MIRLDNVPTRTFHRLPLSALTPSWALKRLISIEIFNTGLRREWVCNCLCRNGVYVKEETSIDQQLG